jgi:hypothetical protein
MYSYVLVISMLGNIMLVCLLLLIIYIMEKCLISQYIYIYSSLMMKVIITFGSWLVELEMSKWVARPGPARAR